MTLNGYLNQETPQDRPREWLFFKKHELQKKTDHFVSVWMNQFALCAVSVCSVVSNSLVTPSIVAYQPPLSMEFSGQECWSGLPFLTPGDLPDPGIEPTSPEAPALVGGFFTTAPPGEPKCTWLLNALYFDINDNSYDYIPLNSVHLEIN